VTYPYWCLFAFMWLAWACYWWAASHDVKAIVRREPLRSRLLHFVPISAALALLWLPDFPIPVLGERFLPDAVWPSWLGLLITLAGLLFAAWARVQLGRNWSATITVKQDHDLITSGPYSLVRHPIYTGLLLGLVGIAVARAEWRDVLAIALAFGAFWRKLRIEERWMREQFGDAYEQYARRVAALVPFVL
jgi:protein-S-isoprenylcysteine O-methyltransferase Ste14